MKVIKMDQKWHNAWKHKLRGNIGLGKEDFLELMPILINILRGNDQFLLDLKWRIY